MWMHFVLSPSVVLCFVREFFISRKMRLICFWCALLAAAAAQSSEDGFYAPQTFKNHVRSRPRALFLPAPRMWTRVAPIQVQMNRIEAYQQGLFTPAGAAGRDAAPQGTVVEPWRPLQGPAPVSEPWRDYGPASYRAAPAPAAPLLPRPEPWQAYPSKEQKANILHHKQALTSEGSFRFEYASDNGLAAGETIEPDGSRLGAYQYKDPSGQLVSLKYRAGKDGFQILEGSHLPKSPEPVAPANQEPHHQQAYEQQRRQYDLQQQYNQQRVAPQQYGQNQNQNQGYEGQRAAAAGQQYYTQNFRPSGQEDDGQYRENEIEDANNRGPHNFGEGYAFSFQG